MDLLSDLFRQAGLRRRLLNLRVLSPTVALRFPCERSLGVHVVVQGPVWLHAAAGDAPQRLDTGDIALMARGCTHWLSTAPSLDGLTVMTAVPALPDDGPPLPGPPLPGPGDAPSAAHAAPPAVAASAEPLPRVIGGAYQLWNEPLHPFFRQLPDWVLVRRDELPTLGPLSLVLGLLQQEAIHDGPAAQTIVHGLMDAAFGHLLRVVMARQQAQGVGWGHALADPAIARVVSRMQAEPEQPWTLERLARDAGLSRTALAERFREALGDTPLNHLRTLRMQRAMHLLSETSDPLERIAQAVGYTDAFSFSKVFKRVTGQAPAEFRRRDAAERALPWRLGERVSA